MNINLEAQKLNLEAEKLILEQELNSIGVQDKDDPANWSVIPSEREQNIESEDDLADRMEDLIEREATEVPLELRLKEINHAIAKINANNYGFCELGGEEIEEDRLLANPSARTCKAHLNDEEKLPPLE